MSSAPLFTALGYPVTMSHVSRVTVIQPPRPAALRVLIVEDHRLVSEALARALEGEHDIVVTGLSQTIAEALRHLQQSGADVVLLDFHLPDGDGLVAARQILKAHPDTRVIIVTAQEERNLLTQALQAGCSGFIGKSESFVHVPNAIRSAAAGTTAISPGLVAKLVTPNPRQGELADDLDARELEILRLLANGVPSKDIADRLFVSQKTLRNQLNRINMKLDTHSKLEAVAKALRIGVITVQRRDEGTQPQAPKET